MSSSDPDNKLRIKCSNCSKVIRVPDSMRGKTGKCPACGSRIKIPEETIPSEEAPADGEDSPSKRAVAPLTVDAADGSGKLPREFAAGVETISSRAVLVVWSLRIMMLVLASRVFVFWRLYESRRPTDVLEMSEMTTLVVGLLMLAFTGILYLRWKYQANANLHAACKRRLKYSPFGSCVYYFVPLLNFVFPMRALSEIQSRSKANVGYMVYTWWALLMGSTLLERAFYLQPGSSVLIGRDWIVLMVIASLRIIAGFFLIKVIRAVTEKQRRYRLAIEDVLN